jgi:hypothetical protein
MTSQIILINQLGVGIASDTLMTSGTPKGKKSTPSSNKIFEIGDCHSVVVLHSGDVFLGGIDIEFLINEWSFSLSESLSTVSEYAASFQDWLKTFKTIPMDTSSILHEYFCSLFEEFADVLDVDLHRELLGTEELTPDLERKLLEELNSFSNETVMKMEQIQGLTKVQCRKIIDDSAEDVAEHIFHHIASYFNNSEKNSWVASKKLKNEIYNFAAEALSRKRAFGRIANLNFVGFGKDDVIASQVRYSIFSWYADRPIGEIIEEFPVRDDMSINGHWYAPAQADAIESFVTGMSTTTENHVRSFVMKASDELLDEVSQIQLADDFRSELLNYRRKEFVYPFLESVSTLSVRGLLRFAEALLQIECLRAAAGYGLGTVGGEIDSLIITKKDGIKWCYRMIDDIGGNGHSPHPFL